MNISLAGMSRPVWRLTCTVAFAAMMLPMASANAAECGNRGTLANIYCDENGDLVADTPTDPAKLLNPDTLVFAYTPVDRKSTRLNSVTNAHLVCRLLLEKKKKNNKPTNKQ